MKKFPFVKQDGIKNCGAAALSMIIQFHKGYIGLDELNNKLKTSHEGTSAYSLVKTAIEFGFSAYGREFDLACREEIILPCIAYTTIDNKFHHYVVIYKIDYQRETVLYADPGVGFLNKSFDEFNRIFNRIVIILYPIKNIPYKSHYSFTKVSLSIIKNYKLKIFYLWFLSLIGLALSLIGTFYFKILFDNLIDNKLLLYIPIIFIFLLLIKVLISYIRNIVSIKLSTQIDRKLTFENFEKLFSLPYSYYHNYTTGDLVSRMNDLHVIKSLFSRFLSFVMVDFTLCIGIIILLFIFNISFAYIVILLLIIYLILNYLLQKKNSLRIDLTKDKYYLSNSYLTESLTGIKNIKGISIENDVKNNFERRYDDFLSEQLKSEVKFIKQLIISDFIISFSEIVILFYGFLLVYLSEMQLSDLIIVNALILYLFDICKNAVSLNIDVHEGSVILSRIFELNVKTDSTGIVDCISEGTIEFKNFTYTNDEKLLFDNVSLKIKAGNKVLVLGPSGTGKSTLFNILMKYYSIDNGQVFIDGIDINEYNDSSIKEAISYLTQEQFLYTDTIMNNINYYGNEEDIKKITELCYVNNLNYLIEENGFNISGGEKQRITLCRTLIKPSKIILIDEGLNQIDINLERKILKNIFSYFQNETIIIISHRMDNMDLYDQLLELKDNKIEKLHKNSH